MGPKPGFPATLVYMDKKQAFLAALVATASLVVSYQVGRERQRRWIDKHMKVTVA